ncbi:MAG: outer membrane beta-barrel protein [Tannerella sp.]|jgi:opacity protein-like surface antigen|nr:outer membrane beta-barrel protein [Tannerella sp.]
MKQTDKKERQLRWEEAVRSKLKDYEAETATEDWEAIADRLPGRQRRAVALHVRRYAAAAVALLLVSAGGYFYHRQQQTRHAAALSETLHRETAKPEHLKLPAPLSPPALSGALPTGTLSRILPAVLPAKAEKSPVEPLEEAIDPPPAPPSTEEPSRAQTPPVGEIAPPSLLAEASPVSSKKRSQRRWSIGVGGSSYSIGTGDGGRGGVNIPMSDHSLVYNAEAPPGAVLRSKEEKQQLSHNYPLSFGLGVGYALNGRWALQSGLTYTLLRSEWITVSDYPGEARQQLHFIGIPLSANCKIAEWNRFHFYTTGGILAEWNVGGQIRTDYLNGGEKLRTQTESVRMKRWLWSVHARAGVSYPLVRFVSAYAEGGASYYFDNGSSIETIRSDQPFQLSLQAGIRLGF